MDCTDASSSFNDSNDDVLLCRLFEPLAFRGLIPARGGFPLELLLLPSAFVVVPPPLFLGGLPTLPLPLPFNSRFNLNSSNRVNVRTFTVAFRTNIPPLGPHRSK